MNLIPPPRRLLQRTARSEYINKAVDFARAQRHIPSAHSLLMETPYGTFRRGRPGGSSSTATTIQRCKISAVDSDGNHLVCVVLNNAGASTGEVINVARPTELRSVNQSRVVTVVTGPPAGTITEEIKPPYQSNDEIYVALADGMTNVFVGTEQVEWIDINVDARHWKPVYAAVCVKVLGTEKQMIVVGGAPF